MNVKNIQKKINKAIGVRENGELDKSRALFESLLDEIRNMLHKNSPKELKNIYASAMGQYIIQLRLEAKNLQNNALSKAFELLEYDRENKLKNSLSTRAVSNTLIDLGQFEKAEDYLRKLIPLFKGNSAEQGDTKTHLAYCFLRTGRRQKALKLIDEGINDIEKNTANKSNEFLAVWLSYAFWVKSLIQNSKGKQNESLKFAKKALEVAKKEARHFRVREATELLEFLKQKKTKQR